MQVCEYLGGYYNAAFLDSGRENGWGAFACKAVLCVVRTGYLFVWGLAVLFSCGLDLDLDLMVDLVVVRGVYGDV